MVKMINKLTGTEMWVDSSRMAEYLNAGHKLITKHGENPGNAPEKTLKEMEQDMADAAETLKATIATLPKAPAKATKAAPKTTKAAKATTTAKKKR